MGTRHLLLFFIAIFPYSYGYETFQSKIPNGNSVPDPCNSTIIWQAVGHKAAPGGGPRNPFGIDFYSNGMVWTNALCFKDSDGDGMINGEELGDPECVWEPGIVPSHNATGHPGICEPWSHPDCIDINSWYTCQPADLECDAINSPDVMNMTVSLPELTVPAKETTYMCMNFELPIDTDYHIIAEKGAIVNHNVIHHIIIFACAVGVTPNYLQHSLNEPYECGMIGEDACPHIITLWTVGMSGTCHNEMGGFKIGKTGYRYATLQVHWNNPDERSGYVDSSGVTVYYTPNLRPYNLGNLAVGELSFAIPPGETAYTVESECSDVCSAKLMNSSIFIIGGINHMHYMGKEMITSFYSGGEKIAAIEDYQYSYDDPIFHTFHTPLEIKEGDVIKTKCTFQSTNKIVTTYQGDATADEMCYSFLIYYPKEAVDGPSCLTLDTLPRCSFDSYTDVVHGCQMRLFYEDSVKVMSMLQKIGQLCVPYSCQKECKEYVEMIRENPCLQGAVGKYVMLNIRNHYNVSTETMLLYHSCDVDIALEDSTTECQCTTPTPNECNHNTNDSASANQTATHILVIILIAVYLV